MKLLRIAIIIAIIICVFAGAGLLAVNYVASRIIDEGIAGIVENQAVEPVKDKPADKDKSSMPQEAVNSESPSAASSNSSVENQEDKGVQSEKGQQPQSELKPEEEKAEIAKANEVSNAELQQVSKQVSMQEKMEVTKMVVSKLSSKEIAELSAMAAGGVTAEEKKKAIDIVYSKFTPAEIEYFKEMYSKYFK